MMTKDMKVQIREKSEQDNDKRYESPKCSNIYKHVNEVHRA